MKITYLGHSSFLIEGDKGRIVTDPFRGIGYDVKRVDCDYCLVSHGHFDHDYTAGVNAGKIVESSTDGFVATESYHDAALGSLRGGNRIFSFTVDGIRCCHLGDVGEYFSADLAEELGEVDVLMIPVGGKYTIDATEAVVYVEGIRPKVVIPMHYKTEKSELDIATADAFLRKSCGVEKVGKSIVLTKDSLPEDRAVYLMEIDAD